MFQIVHNAWLIAIAGEVCNELSVVHTTKYCALANLEAVKMEDWQYGARFGRIYILEAMPAPFE